MWHGRPPAIGLARNSQNPRQSQRRTWVLLGGIAFIAIMGMYLVSGLMSSGPAPADTLTASGTSDSSGYLSGGYAQLDGAEQSSMPSLWGLWGSILLPLLVVIIFIYIGLRGLKYVNSKVASVASQTRLLESLDSLPLGQHGAIHLIRIGPRVVAIGAAGQTVTLLTELGAEQADEILDAHRQESDSQSGLNRDTLQPFRDLLMSRLTPTERSEETPPR